MRRRPTLPFVIALGIGLAGPLGLVEAGVVNVGPDGTSQTLPSRVTGLQYKIHVDAETSPGPQSKRIFGAIRFHNADNCPPGGCAYYQLETTLESKTIEYNDIEGCPPWPDTTNGDVGLGASLLVNIIDYTDPKTSAVGLKPDTATLATFPRQSVGVDNNGIANIGLTRIASWSQMNVTGKTMAIKILRGDPMVVALGARVTGWGHRFAPEPDGGWMGGPATCIDYLPDGITYQRWNLSVTIDGTIYQWEVALPEGDATHISVGGLTFGTESFEFAEHYFAARYFDVAYLAEGATVWTPVTHFTVGSREENVDVCNDPNILTSYGWGVRKRPFGSSCSMQFANEREANDYYDAQEEFELDAACVPEPHVDPPTEEPPPPLPAGANIAAGKAVSQSSTFQNLPHYVPENGVDGFINCVPGTTITHTGEDDRAWWQVNLGSVELVTRVVIFNRMDCCQGRLRNYDVILSENPFPDDAPVDPALYAHYHENDPFDRFKVVHTTDLAQYVRVQLRDSSEYLHLSEVQVYADCGNGQTDPWEDCDGESCCTAVCHKAAFGTACDDGDLCTGPDTCDGTSVTCPTTPVVCDDGNACNGVETCDPGTGCHAGTPPACNDGNACNGVETCNPGTGCQAGTPLTCNDGNACNGVETCNPGTGCQAGTPLTCNDGSVCNGVETCNPGTGCQAGTPLTCNDGNPCNGMETCHPVNGCQGGTPLNCNDGNVCTTDSCGASGCQHLNNEIACNDGNPCTVGDVCYQGTCVPSALKVCPDSDQNPDFWEHCQVSTGNCIQSWGGYGMALCGNGLLDTLWSEECDDGNRVSGDCCSSTCKLEGPLCEDGNACTFPDVCQGGPLSRVCVSGVCRPDFNCGLLCGLDLSCQGPGGCQCSE